MNSLLTSQAGNHLQDLVFNHLISQADNRQAVRAARRRRSQVICQLVNRQGSRQVYRQGSRPTNRLVPHQNHPLDGHLDSHRGNLPISQVANLPCSQTGNLLLGLVDTHLGNPLQNPVGSPR